MGWNCTPLGLPRKLDRSNTGALRIDITAQTQSLLKETGTWVPSRLVMLDDAHLANC
jgi:acyl-homoserine lactone synthase